MNVLKAISICANNAARLEYYDRFNDIHEMIIPLCDKICEQIDDYKYMKSISSYFKTKCYYSLAYLDIHSDKHILDTKLKNEKSNFYKLNEAVNRMKIKPETSVMQREVCGILKEQKIRFTEERKIHNYRVDIFIEPKSIIEFDGKFHYFSDTSIIQSEKLIKYYYLKHKGYDVISICYKNWKTPEDRKKTMDEIFLKLGHEDLFADD